jgi:hypothetical protein
MLIAALLAGILIPHILIIIIPVTSAWRFSLLYARLWLSLPRESHFV